MPTPVTPIHVGALTDNATTSQHVQAFDPDTRLNPMPARKVVGPSGTMDTDQNLDGLRKLVTPAQMAAIGRDNAVRLVPRLQG